MPSIVKNMNLASDFNFNGLKALVRVDFNVPLNAERQITDNTRIVEALPTINKILSDGGAMVLMSHLGRPKGIADEKYSLQPVVAELQKLINRKIYFAPNCIGEATQQAVANLKSGEILLLENVRFHAEEETGDANFAKQLADLGCQVYVNDAFGTAHRAHASTCTIAQFFKPQHRLMGMLLAEEVQNAKRFTEQAQSPVVAILGGAKVSDKILLIENLLNKVDTILIGGGMVYTFVKAMGLNIGKSLCENDRLEVAQNIWNMAKQAKATLALPIDSLCAAEFNNDAPITVHYNNELPDDKMGLDIGPESIPAVTDIILKAKTIFWNGPMGVFEMPNFAKGTKAIAHAVAKATQQNGAFSLVGGGDSVAALKQLGLDSQISYVSTGGGAMLELLEGKELPGVKALMPDLKAQTEQ